jgi:predicted peptidase
VICCACKLLVVGLLCLAWLSIVPARSAGDPPATGFVRQVYKDAMGQEFNYAVFVPLDYKGDKPYPLILFLHGLGESGTDGKQVEVGIGPAIAKREKTFPSIVVFPQAAKPTREIFDTWYADQPDGKRALAILDIVQKQYKVDPRRVYLTGLSMGGFGTWSLAATFPDRWAAIAPVCGGGDPKWADKIKHIACWAFHGEKDDAVPVKYSRQMIAALKAAGAEPKYDEYKDVGHNSWDRAYDTDGLFEWLLKQRLK